MRDVEICPWMKLLLFLLSFLLGFPISWRCNDFFPLNYSC
jgi:hypothetical protein